MNSRSQSAFTLIEMLVVISIIAILAAFAVPALTSALTKGQMTGTMNNARQLFLAAQQMSLDGTTNSDPNYGWPGSYTNDTTLQNYASRLYTNGYLQAGDLQKILNGPGTTCTVVPVVPAPTTGDSLTITNRPSLKVYKVVEGDSSSTIFAVTNNYTYDSDLVSTGATSVPYSDKGFVVMRKGGDASIFKKNQATSSGFASPQAFQSTVGAKTTDAINTPTKGDGNTALQ